MSLLKKNIAANFVGNIWQAITGLAFVPFYIRFIGIEAWGLIGVFATLQSIFGLLDMGLSATLNREMARLSALSCKEQEARDLVRTLELPYWCVTVFVGVIIALLSPFIAHHWVKAGQLSIKTIEQALLIIGFAIALQMPVGLYSGGLMGLQKHVLLNGINIGVSALRGVGAILILWLVSPTIQAYFLWQIIISIANVFLLMFFLWHSLPVSGKKAVFQEHLFKGIWKFTTGMSGITALAVILTQLDKIILSRMLSLEMFGYYMLASMVAMSLGRLFNPVFYGIYPRFTQLVAINNQDGLKELYHKSCQFISVLVLPVAIVIALFSYEVILLWTQNPVTAEKTHFLVSILICGTALNGLMNPPYALQLAFGWTKLSVCKNVIAVILLAPLTIYMAKRYGAIGAASAWLILNIGYVLFEVPTMHRKLLCTEKWRWYWQDVGVPLITGLSLAGLGRLFVNRQMPQFIMLLYLIIILVLTLGITLVSVPTIRLILYRQLLKTKQQYLL